MRHWTNLHLSCWCKRALAITLVAGAFLSADLAAGNPSSAIDTSGANLLVGGASWFNAQPTYTDSKGNTWAFVRNDSFFGIANLDSYYVSAPVVGSAHTVTPTGNNGALSLAAFTGVLASSPFDQATGVNDSDGGSSIQSVALTPSEDNCLIVAVLYFESGAVSSIDGGFTLLSSAVGGSGTAIAYKVQTTAAAVSPTWTLSTGNSRLDAQLLSFKAAAGGGGASRLWAPTMTSLGAQ